MKKSNYEFDFAALGKRIHVRRKELGLTQEQLAEKVECSLTHLCRIESGHRPSLIVLLRLSAFLGYSLDDLTGLHFSPNPYVQEASKLLFNHSLEKQAYALQMLRHFFAILDQLDEADYLKGKAARNPDLLDLDLAASYMDSAEEFFEPFPIAAETALSSQLAVDESKPDSSAPLLSDETAN